MSHTFTNLLTHIIFSTKGRLASIDDKLRPDLHAYIGGIVREMNGSSLMINGTSDHVHLLIWLPPVVSISEAMRIVKTNSSKWVHAEWSSRGRFAWQIGYGAFSVSQSNVPTVSRYIANQEEHHRKISFEEEFIAYLKRHKIEYDEKYIWE